MTVEEMLGKTFGRLKIISVDHIKTYGRHKVCYVLCECICGNTKICNSKTIRRGECLSCGCLLSETSRKKATKHGLANHYLYGIWSNIIQRCTNPKYHKYPTYGARGIRVCFAWRKSFKVFHDYILTELGDRPSKEYSLDRINNNGHYEPKNLRWATRKTQQRNTSRNHLIIWKSKTYVLTELAEQHNKTYLQVYNRLHNGWTLKDALTQPVK